ncbi:hypothetical protein CR513_62348, partial [Mucuna pruriens]
MQLDQHAATVNVTTKGRTLVNYTLSDMVNGCNNLELKWMKEILSIFGVVHTNPMSLHYDK